MGEVIPLRKKVQSINSKGVFIVHHSDVIVVDGDTFYMKIRKMEPRLFFWYKVRIKGLDTPEIKGETQHERRLAIKAKQHLEKLLARSRRITVKLPKHCKYPRIVAQVMVDGEDVAVTMINEGLGRENNGEKRESWADFKPKKKRVKKQQTYYAVLAWTLGVVFVVVVCLKSCGG